MSDNYFPSDVLKWMKANSSANTAIKLMQICKYFQHPEFPYTPVEKVYGCHKWDVEYLPLRKEEDADAIIKYKKLNLHDIAVLWITKKLRMSCKNGTTAKMLFSKIIVCDLRELYISYQQLTFKEFRFLTSGGKVIYLFLSQTTIKYKSSNEITMQGICECVPKLEQFKW